MTNFIFSANCLLLSLNICTKGVVFGATVEDISNKRKYFTSIKRKNVLRYAIRNKLNLELENLLLPALSLSSQHILILSLQV